MGPLARIRYDMNHGAPRRILQTRMAAWAAAQPAGTEVLEVGAAHYDHRPLFLHAKLTKFDADAAQHPDIIGDAHAMPMEDERFDAALAISVLEHVDDPYQVVREMYRVLKPGAPVLAWIPFTFGVHGFPEDVSRFTTHGMQRLFELAGFEVERVDEKPYSGPFMMCHGLIHFVLPRTSHRRWVRGLNKGLFFVVRPFFGLEDRLGLRLKNIYVGAELEARKPLSA